MDNKPIHRRQFTPEFKVQVVLESLQRDTTIEAVSRKYGVISSVAIFEKPLPYGCILTCSFTVSSLPSYLLLLHSCRRDIF